VVADKQGAVVFQVAAVKVFKVPYLFANVLTGTELKALT